MPWGCPGSDRQSGGMIKWKLSWLLRCALASEWSSTRARLQGLSALLQPICSIDLFLRIAVKVQVFEFGEILLAAGGRRVLSRGTSRSSLPNGAGPGSSQPLLASPGKAQPLHKTGPRRSPSSLVLQLYRITCFDQCSATGQGSFAATELNRLVYLRHLPLQSSSIPTFQDGDVLISL
jgi:hypothetical protein